MESLLLRPATEIVHAIAVGDVSAVEVVGAHLDRIARVNPRVNAFVDVRADAALADARAQDRAAAAGSPRGPLGGLPVTVKSAIEVAGLRSETGSRSRAGAIASEDAVVVARLRAAGAIVLGTTNVADMLMAYESDNPLHGRTSNPWALDRTPGGSSGGEAAAIASGCSAGGIGSDGGGSIRVPAHFSGICGLKPTPGRIPGTGHYPPCAGPFSLIGVVGPMARTINDLQLLFEVIAGYDLGDPCSVPLPVQPIYKGEVQKLRIGYYEDDQYSSPTPETRNAVRTAATSLKNAGFEIEPFRPQGLERARELWTVIFVDGIGMVTEPMVEGHEDQLSSNTREFLALAGERPPLTGESLLNTLLERDQLRRQFLEQMEEFPILLSPVCSIPTFRHEDAG